MSFLGLKVFLCLPALGDVIDDRHQKAWAVLRAGNERDLVSDPDEAAILASVALFNLDLLAFSLHEFPDKRPVSFTILLVSSVQKWKGSKFFLGVPEHHLISGIGSQEPT